MGKITFIVEGTTVGTVAEGRGVVEVFDVSEKDSARLVAAMAAFHASDLERLARSRDVTDEDGNVVRQGTTDLGDILKEWFRGCVRQALRITEDYERREVEVSKVQVSGL